MKWIVNISGGAGSVLSAERTIEAQGKDAVVLLFADVLVEHADLYEFNAQASKLFGVPITRVSKEMTPWELFRKEHMIGNSQVPICSIRLKREPLNEWMETNYNLDQTQDSFIAESAAVVLGFDWTELHRVEAFQKQHPRWRLDAPMTRPPLLNKCQIIERCVQMGFKKQTLYELGFPHNNCGGACVRGGISQWVQLHNLQRERFLSEESEEQRTIAEFAALGIGNDFSILRDRRGGIIKPMTLRTLRERIEAGEKFPLDEWGGCGCGGAV